MEEVTSTIFGTTDDTDDELLKELNELQQPPAENGESEEAMR
jgi:hypothetical protein